MEIKAALPKLLDIIESKEIRVVQGAFNSTPAFITTFQSTALLSITIGLLKLEDAIKRVGAALECIRSELAIANVAKVQGWEKDGFGSHIYRFVHTEIAASSRCQDRHYFYVWHPDTDWYPNFEERQRDSPLGPNFGGYNKDLDTICQRMSSDRMTLIRTTAYGRDAVFHLLIPAYQPIVTNHPITFHGTLFPLVVTGQRPRGIDFAWFNLPKKPQGLTLNCVGVLKEEIAGTVKYGTIGFFSGFFGVVCFAAATAVFPPCAPVAGYLIVPSFAAAWGSGATALGGKFYYDILNAPNLQVLGGAIFTDPEAESVQR
ncbi:hypothetical protein LTR47_011864 [Exophiala xenobiotica]|nr:hypothetical protein LTR92_011657 [Exophiala xenobiotica]KAK5202337.1 hypothetical protein LTR41_011919 [Exophiala xenobiotica]KAK5217372.1 hypothetical protein LTR47_011864 [Exophiala xenobiotica]KAK5242278.1 hypothetical protein LTS06_011622 [Exophiala xenobiotica]KAK5279809.1 hypothetical protein LTR40_007250 [Exophiala xenobiotica]